MLKLRYPSKRRRLLLGLAVGGAVFAVASAVQASIPDASGVIHGCYNPKFATAKNGTPLNVIDSTGASCATGMKAIAWNQRGPTGVTGASGPSGPRGATGGLGPSGARGTTGAPGPSGARGATGPTGPTSISGLETVTRNVSVPAGSYTSASLACPTGKSPISGGFNADNSTAFDVEESHAFGSDWLYTFYNGTGSSINVELDALCAVLHS